MKDTTIPEKLRAARRLLLLEALRRAGLEPDEIHSAHHGWDKTVPLPSGCYELLKGYQEGKTELLTILVGPPGTGKTKVAAMCARLYLVPRLQSPGKTGLMWLNAVNAGHTMDKERAANFGHTELPERAANATLLVIDDLGSSGVTRELEEVVLRRYREENPTIVTMNSLEQTDARLLSRFSGRGYNFGKLQDYRGK